MSVKCDCDSETNFTDCVTGFEMSGSRVCDIFFDEKRKIKNEKHKNIQKSNKGKW